MEEANLLAERYDINNAKLFSETGRSESRDPPNSGENSAYVDQARLYVLRDPSVMAECRSSFK